MEKSGKFYRFPRTFFKIATTEFKTNKIIVFKLRVLYSKYAELKDITFTGSEGLKDAVLF